MSPRRRRLLTLGLATIAAASLAPGALPPPGVEPWSPHFFRGIERHTHYAALPGEDGVRARADCSASALVLPLEAIDLDRTPVLHWRWQVTQSLVIEDERSREGDDFAARVYLMFRFQTERASLIERARHRLGRRLFGRELPGSVLSFVWASREQPGARWANPYAKETRMIALVRGRSADWKEEAVDVVAEYRRSFEGDPPAPLALGIMTDADDTCQSAAARYAGFRFEAAG